MVVELVRPVGVRLLDVEGNVWPVEVTYRGFRDGAHQWRVVVPEGLSVRVESLTCEVLPAHTAIQFPVLPE